MFQSIGERLNKFASVVIRRAKCYLRCNTTEATEMNLMFATGMLSSIIITTGIMMQLIILLLRLDSTKAETRRDFF
jgi:hypothetical protein